MPRVRLESAERKVMMGEMGCRRTASTPRALSELSQRARDGRPQVEVAAGAPSRRRSTLSTWLTCSLPVSSLNTIRKGSGPIALVGLSTGSGQAQDDVGCVNLFEQSRDTESFF